MLPLPSASAPGSRAATPLRCKSRVLNLVNADPNRRSSSCLMSTAMLSCGFGSRRLASARVTSLCDRALNRARRHLMPGLDCLHMSITSNAMFSPSLSQSSQRMSQAHRLASLRRFSATFSLPLSTCLTTRAPSMSSRGLHVFHPRCDGGKSRPMTCPVTDVNTMSHLCPITV